jgi:hypothetical protein
MHPACRAARALQRKSQTDSRVFNFILKARARPCAAENEAQMGPLRAPRIAQDASSRLMSTSPRAPHQRRGPRVLDRRTWGLTDEPR